jgi:MarR-like DNA-binding transcriptional regulator SgrR of sgrS sRNA
MGESYMIPNGAMSDAIAKAIVDKATRENWIARIKALGRGAAAAIELARGHLKVAHQLEETRVGSGRTVALLRSAEERMSASNRFEQAVALMREILDGDRSPSAP